MSDMNIRLLLYRLWQTWHQSGFAEDRPPSFIFMPRGNQVQEAVLRHWGISVLRDETEEPGLDQFPQRPRLRSCPAGCSEKIIVNGLKEVWLWPSEGYALGASVPAPTRHCPPRERYLRASQEASIGPIIGALIAGTRRKIA